MFLKNIQSIGLLNPQPEGGLSKSTGRGSNKRMFENVGRPLLRISDKRAGAGERPGLGREEASKEAAILCPKYNMNEIKHASNP